MMTTFFFQLWHLRSILLYLLSFCALFGMDAYKFDDATRHFSSSAKQTTSKLQYADTVTVRTAEALQSHIRCNRLIKLIHKEYVFQKTLLIDQIENLKIVGTAGTKLRLAEQNATVLSIANSQNIQLDSLVIGHTHPSIHQGKQGILRVSHSKQISIAHVKLLGAGTFGFVTNELDHLSFKNSEITKCTVLLFELEKSHDLEFEKLKFHHNDLSISVLGGFTNATNNVRFKDCSFLNNKPKAPGNPAFNFFDNYKDFDQPIIFENCRFKNNKGYQWYGEKIVLKNCEIDSTDFINLQVHKK